MIVTLFLTATGFLIIFVAVRGYSQVVFTPIAGLLVFTFYYRKVRHNILQLAIFYGYRLWGVSELC